jgi:hypothetical protein
MSFIFALPTKDTIASMCSVVSKDKMAPSFLSSQKHAGNTLCVCVCVLCASIFFSKSHTSQYHEIDSRKCRTVEISNTIFQVFRMRIHS